MATPCPRCGATKAESVRHGVLYNLAWKLGYHMRRCSSCNRRRLYKRTDRDRPNPDDLSYGELEAHFNRKIADAGGEPPSEGDTSGPGTSAQLTEAPDDYETFDDADPALAAVAIEKAEEANDNRCCPRCTSTVYRRSHRTFFERLLNRPRMVRCLRCSHRFPFPG